MLIAARSTNGGRRTERQHDGEGMSYDRLLAPDKPSRGDAPPMLTGESAEHFRRKSSIVCLVTDMLREIHEHFEEMKRQSEDAA